MPFGFYFPRLTSKPLVIDKLVANIDIAPTIYQLAGIPQPPEVEGASLIPLIRGQGTWRDWLLIESWGYDDRGRGDTALDMGSAKNIHYPYVAIHTDRYIYIQNIGLKPELYDLQKDPDEMHNVVNDPQHADIAKELNAKDDFYRGPFMTTLAQLLAMTPTAVAP